MSFYWTKTLVCLILIGSVKCLSNSSIDFPCLRYLDELPEDSRAQGIPKYLRKQLLATTATVELFTRPIRTVEQLCWYVQHKVSAILTNIYKVDIDARDLPFLLFNSSSKDNRTVSMKRIAELHLLSCKFLIENTLSVRKKFCKINKKIYNGKTFSCDERDELHGTKTSNTNNKRPKRVLQIIKIAKIIGNSTSIIFLMLLFLIFLKCKSLQAKFPSRCILCLSIMQVILHGLPLIALKGVQNQQTCTGISILSHWSSISCFLWLFFISCEKQFSVSDKFFLGKEERFIAYLSVAFGLSAVLVLVCTVVNFSTDNLIGYGEDDRCFISHTLSNTIVFIIPISLTFGANLVLSATAYSRHKKLKKAQNYSAGKNGWSRSSTFLSITTLTFSLQIIISRVAELFPYGSYKVRESAGLVLSLQGLLFFIAFACNRNVLIAVRKKLKKEEAPSRLTYKYRYSDRMQRRL